MEIAGLMRPVVKYFIDVTLLGLEEIMLQTSKTMRDEIYYLYSINNRNLIEGFRPYWVQPTNGSNPLLVRLIGLSIIFYFYFYFY